MSSLISIVLATYNSAATLSEAINSVLNQSCENWELLIINDGSIDDTEGIIKAFQDKRIRYFYQENQGVSAARNLGLGKMKGDFFSFLDADDVLSLNSLKSRLDVFEQDEKIEFVDGGIEIYNMDFTKTIKKWMPGFSGNPLNDLISLTGKSFFGPSWMIKRRSGINYQFNEGLTHGEDLLFYINIARFGGIYAYTNNIVLHYRTGNQSAMSNINGLEKGYQDIYYEILKMDDIPQNLKSAYFKKARSIVVKSYLGRWKPFDAFHSIFKKW